MTPKREIERSRMSKEKYHSMRVYPALALLQRRCLLDRAKMSGMRFVLLTLIKKGIGLT